MGAMLAVCACAAKEALRAIETPTDSGARERGSAVRVDGGAGPTALFIDKREGLVRYDVAAERREVIASGAFSFCEYDPGNDAVWVAGVREDFQRAPRFESGE